MFKPRRKNETQAQFIKRAGREAKHRQRQGESAERAIWATAVLWAVDESAIRKEVI